MSKRILLQIKDKYLKGVTIKSLIESGFEIIEILGYEDLLFKLNIYPNDFSLFIIEINEDYLSIFEKVLDIRKEGIMENIPILGLIQKDTRNIIDMAHKSGFNDLMLIPNNQTAFKNQLNFKLSSLIKEFNPPTQGKIQVKEKNLDINRIKELADYEISTAKRGKYPVSFLMNRFTNLKKEIIDKIHDQLSNTLRKTDKVYWLDNYAWIIICPYTEKKHIINVEHKIYDVLMRVAGVSSTVKYVSLGSATYPMDSENFDKILEILEAGVKADLSTNTLKGTLDSIPKNELVNYKKIMEKYKLLSHGKKQES